MPAALPSALRARFQQYIEEGLSGRAAAARLKISAATGVRWQRKLRETGSIEPELHGSTPLHTAASLIVSSSVIEALVNAGADPTIRDRDGTTPSDQAKDYLSFSEQKVEGRDTASC